MPRGTALLLLIMLGAIPASAGEPSTRIGIQLDYTLAAGTSCQAEKVLHDEVARHLGYDPFRADAPGRITVRIGPNERGVGAVVASFDVEGARTWTREAAYPAESCPALISWLGMVIAFHLDHELSPAPAPRAPMLKAAASALALHPPRETPPPPAPATLEPSTPSAKRTSTGRVTLALGPLLTLGASGPSFGLVGHAGFRWSFFSLGGDLRYDAPSSTPVSTSTHGARLQASAVGGALVPCAHLRPAFFCALFTSGVILGGASALERPQRWTEVYLGAGLRLGAEHAFKPWLGVRLHLDGLVMARNTSARIGGVLAQVPTPLASRVNGAMGLDLVTYF